MSNSDNLDDDRLSLLGVQLQLRGQHAQAADAFRELTRRTAGEPAHWANLGTALRALQDYDAALLAYARAAAMGASSADFRFNVALLHQERGDYPHARILFAEAAAAAPRDPEIHLQYAQCCYELLRLDEARAAITDWEQFDGLTPAHVATIALLLLNLGDMRGSEQAARRLESGAADAQALLRLCQIHERSNRLEEAQRGLALLRADPGTVPADDLALLEGQLAQRARHHDEAARWFTALATREAPHRRHLALFPLARSQQAMGDHVAAWETLRQAHAAQLLQLARSHPEIAAQAEPPLLIARRGCDPSDFAQWKAAPGPLPQSSPVFVVAFPRSGTTLLEQALDAHPDLVSMDEQPFIQQMMDSVEDLGIRCPEKLARLAESDLDRLRAHYWSLVAARVTLVPGQRLVDKNPLNLLRLPIIRRLFPQSPVLLAIRHPLDVLVSCYAQHFRAPEFALLCRDPQTLARSFRRCFDFWYSQAGLLQPQLLELRYEDLVADFDGGMRQVAQFLEIPWDDAMSRPDHRARARGFISTPSYTQVIEPVSSKAVGRWQPYRSELAVAIRELEPYLRRWNYAV